MTTKRRNTMLLVVAAAGLLAVIAGASQLPFMAKTAVPADPAPALALPKAEHVVVSAVDAPIVDVTANGVLVNGKRQPVLTALQALKGRTKPNASGFRRAVVRADASTDVALLEPVLTALHQAGYRDVVAGAQATGPCLSTTGTPLGSACQLAVEPLQQRDDQPITYGLVLHGSGYAIVDSAGSRTEVPNRDGARDLAGLRNALRTLKPVMGPRRDLDVTAEPGLKYTELVTALDLALDEGFTELALAPEARTGARD